MRRLAARTAAALVALATPWLIAPASAQQPVLEPSAAVDCLTPASAERGVPDYPFFEFKNDVAGRVKVTLSFSSPITRPAVKVLEQDGGDAFVDAVEAHVRSFRVPCHDGGEHPAQMVFDFVFRKDDRKVYRSTPTDGDVAGRKAQLDCMAHESGRKSPIYPPAALRSSVHGRVLARLRFDAPGQPPVVEIFTYLPTDAGVRLQRAMALLSDPVKNWVAGYRMPCHQGRPITTSIVFVYQIEGEAFGFTPNLSLTSLLPMVRGIRQQTLALDTTGMDCPFDVELQYRRPHLPNGVSEVGSTDPSRQSILEWLRQIEFDLPPSSLASVYADTARLTIPCLKLDLKPGA